MKIYLGDNIEVLKTIPDNSVDAIVTDPPYGLSFMGKKWDYDVPSVEIWRECYRVLKPGGHLLSFAGTRTQHRMAVNIEDAGFEIRDMIAWVYGSGFPKSLNIGKAISKLTGEEREVIGISNNGSGAQPSKLNNHEKGDTGIGYMDGSGKVFEITKGTSEFEGWGTALKPALEPITVARKPIEKGLSVAENCLKWGTGGINIDGCRVELNGENPPSGSAKRVFASNQFTEEKVYGENKVTSPQGRFPANLIHDGSQEVLELFPNSKSTNSIRHNNKTIGGNGKYQGGVGMDTFGHADSGSAARFFYCAKASKAERNRGCEGLPVKTATELTGRKEGSKGLSGSEEHGNSTNPYANGGSVLPRANYHPTVKPIALMEYLVKLISREGQTVLDPFAGSGTTGIACKNLNRNAILIEREAEYVEIAKARIDYVKNQMKSSKNTVNIFFRKEDEL